ncbi:Cupredoxin [Aspergillus karnatakaensis]|uniref:Cupredoxin n=1 Tax=Aspergillus karnatakaensis TaxID=1810916 RepID=UPI003CCE53B0
MRGLCDTIALLLGLAAATAANVVRHDHSFHPDHILRVTAANYSEACSERYSVLINGSLPGPELRLREGEVSWIRVYNDMTDANTTMHWHGLTAFTAPFSDGAPAASQWPIPPGHFFDYEVRPERGSAGSYFYHSHVGFQAVTAKGPLIVDECDAPPYEYDEERTVLISDYFSETDEQIEAGLVSTNFTWSGETEALLVNGHGRSATNATGSCSLADISVEPEKTYRLRFIGGTALSFVSLAIESHEVTIIEADGHYTQPYETDFLQIGSGQRYSVLLTAKSEAELAKTNKRQFYIQITTLERPEVLTNFAVLSYTDSPDLTTVPSPPPLPIATAVQGWLDYELQPLTPDHDFPHLEEVTRRIIIDVHQNVSDRTIWLQNGYDWVETQPKSPYLVDIYKNQLNLDETYHRALARGNGFDNITRTFPARIGEVLEIVWQNRGTVENGGVDAHPFHAHGRHFYDIGGGDGLYNATANEERFRGTHPIQRDTSVLYRYRKSTTQLVPSGWRAWRIRVTSAGVWMYHCHVLQHMVMGMQTVFTFGDREDILAQSGPVSEGYLLYGGSAYGNATRDPVAQQFKT